MNPYLFLWHYHFKELYKSFKKWLLTPRSIEWLRAVSYCRELDSTQYHTARCQSWKTRQNLYKNLKYFKPLLRGHVKLELWKKQVENLVWLSPLKRIQKGQMIPRSMILCGTSENYEFLSENQIKKENILTHWSVAQAGSNDEKKLGFENLVGLSL